MSSTRKPSLLRRMAAMLTALSICLAAALLFSPLKVSAEDEIVIDLTNFSNVSSGTGWSYDLGTLYLNSAEDEKRTFHLIGDGNEQTLHIRPRGEAAHPQDSSFYGTVILENVNVKQGTSPLDFADSSHATIQLIGTNTVTNTNWSAAMNANGGEYLIKPYAGAINPSFTAIGGSGRNTSTASGIGRGDTNNSSLTLTIEGYCTVNATSGPNGFDIAAQSLTVTGGVTLNLNGGGLPGWTANPTFSNCRIGGSGAGGVGGDYDYIPLDPPEPPEPPDPPEPPVPSEPETPSSPYVPPVLLRDAASGAVFDLTRAKLPEGVKVDEISPLAEPQDGESLPAQRAEGILLSYEATRGMTSGRVLELDLQKEGEPISFDGSVTVSLPLEGESRFVRVFRLEDDLLTLTEIPARINGSMLAFTVEHFSHYVIADFPASVGKLPAAIKLTPQVDPPPSTEYSGAPTDNPKTGAAFPAAALGISTLAALMLLRGERR